MRYLACLFFAGIFLYGCQDEDSGSEKAFVSIYLTDDPANYDAVNVDIQDIEITGPDAENFDIDVNEGIYNLLDFTNGADTLIGMGDLDAGTISQIRLILGPNNSVVADGTSYPLETPSAEESGLKLQVHEELEPGISYSFLLDFDASQSVVETGNGSYQLKPVINVIEVAISGSIKGAIIPSDINCTVTAENGSTFTTSVNENGEFLLQGLPAGSYDVTITPDSLFLPVTITDVEVNIGEVTDLGTITL